MKIDDLALELEVRSQSILDALSALGIRAQRNRSGFLSGDEAARVVEYFKIKPSGTTEIKPKIDLSLIKKPGDVIRLLRGRQKIYGSRSRDQQGSREEPLRRPRTVRIGSPPMGKVAEQHSNEQELLKMKEKLDDNRRTSLALVAGQPIVRQIKESLDEWLKQYRELKVPNKKVDQVVALQELERSLMEERRQSEEDLKFSAPWDSLPTSKRQQYEETLQRLGSASEFEECLVRMYIAAEWTVEQWAKRNRLDCIDLNAANRFSKEDYRIGGRDVDVKTTVSVGRLAKNKAHFFLDDLLETGEIICGVVSAVVSTSETTSQHHIQGIFHAPVYDGLSQHLQYLKLDKTLLNSCYFHSPEIFFDIQKEGLPTQDPDIDADVIEYCAEQKHHLTAIFHLSTQDAEALLRKALPSSLEDFVPVAAELMKPHSLASHRTRRHLLPHFLADYLLGKIHRKQHIDTNAVVDVLWRIFEPSEDQKKYLWALIQAYEILPRVRCAHCPEGIKDMDITVILNGPKPILLARCSTDRELNTTFLAYSRKTFETLIYGESGISVCECGCLTHMLDGRRIGKTTCPNYGKSSDPPTRANERTSSEPQF